MVEQKGTGLNIVTAVVMNLSILQTSIDLSTLNLFFNMFMASSLFNLSNFQSNILRQRDLIIMTLLDRGYEVKTIQNVLNVMSLFVKSLP